MGGHGWAHVMLWVDMRGHKSMLMVMVWVWVQIQTEMLGFVVNGLRRMSVDKTHVSPYIICY
jgi:hypothetical protein